VSDNDSPTVQDNSLKKYNGSSYSYDYFCNLIQQLTKHGRKGWRRIVVLRVQIMIRIHIM